MQVRVTKLEETMVSGKYPAYKIHGESLKDGSSKTKTIFKNQEDLVKKIEAFVKEGVNIDIVLEKNGKYWDPVDILQLDSGSSTGAGGTGGGGKGGFNQEAKDRGICLSYAVKDVIPQIKGANVEGMSVDEYMTLAKEISDKMVAYVSGKEAEVDPRSLVDDTPVDSEGEQPDVPEPPE